MRIGNSTYDGHSQSDPDIVLGEPIRVLHFVESWMPRTQNWLYNHLTYLPPQIESHVVCQWSQHLDEFPTTNLFSLEEPPTQDTLLSKILFRLRLQENAKRHLPLLEEVIQTTTPHILHSHFGYCGAINAALARKYRIPHVVSFYGLDVGYLPKIQRRWLSRYRHLGQSAAAVLCEGPHMRRSIAALGIPEEKIRIMRLGIDLARIPFRPRLNPYSKTVRFLIAGTFREKKGIPYAIEALGKASRTFANFGMTIIGDAGSSDRERSEKQKILRCLDHWGLASKTRLLGYVPHDVLIEQFYQHHIFLSPSVTAIDGDSEGGAPLTIIEAAASGMPVVSTTHCDIPFVLSEQNRAFLAPERDTEALAAIICKLVAHSDWSSFISANRQFIETTLDVRELARRLGRIYAEVVHANRGIQTIEGGVSARTLRI